jgi:hypothetical protein
LRSHWATPQRPTPPTSSASPARYTPNANFNGADSFSYKANDGMADSTVATVSLTVISAASQINQMVADVQALVDSGTLNGGRGNALITKLGNAQNDVTSGQTSQAISMLHALINQLNSFISTGVLTSAEGQPLIDAANAAIHSLGG